MLLTPGQSHFFPTVWVTNKNISVDKHVLATSLIAVPSASWKLGNSWHPLCLLPFLEQHHHYTPAWPSTVINGHTTPISKLIYIIIVPFIIVKGHTCSSTTKLGSSHRTGLRPLGVSHT